MIGIGIFGTTTYIVMGQHATLGLFLFSFALLCGCVIVFSAVSKMIIVKLLK